MTARLWPSFLLLTAALIGCGAAPGQAGATLPPQPQEQPHAQPPETPPLPTANLSRVDWSAATTWPGGKLPAAGQSVTLPAGKRVVLDVSPPDLAGLTIPAGSALEFAEQDLTLRAGWIMLHGELRVGSEASPFTHRAEIVLTDQTPGEDVMGMGDRVIGVMGGALELHGQPRLAWTRLGATAPAGSRTLTLDRAPDWAAGDTLTLTSTDFGPTQTEEVAVQSVSGRTVTLALPLKYTHWGQDAKFGTRTVSERAEVGLLTRNIRISAGEDALKTGLGAQIMVMAGGQARIEGAELTRVGQRNTLRRYPVHFHQVGDASASYVRGNSIHGSFNRCVTIHGTRNLRVQDNVTYDSVGHCLFLEDGDETGNTLSGNLITRVRAPDKKRGETPLLPSDKHPAAFWLTNPANTVTGNVAAGVDGVGFWYALPEHPTGLAIERGKTIWPRRTPLGVFRDNLAHSGDTGLNVDDGPRPDGTTESAYYQPLSNPADGKSAGVRASFGGFTAYKQRDHGVWLRGAGLTLGGATLADNGVGATFAANDSVMDGALLVGETPNLGTPEDWEAKGTGGRSLPRPWDAAFPVRGFQFYDGHVSIQNSAVAAFKSTSVRQASGLGYLTANAFALEPQNDARGLSWLDDSARVYFPPAKAGMDGDLAATFLDADGSVGGAAGNTVTASPLLKDAPDCAAKTVWNASLCAGQYAHLWLNDTTGGKIAPLNVKNMRGTAISLSGTPGNSTDDFHTSVRLNETYALTPSGASAHLRLGFGGRKPGDTLRLSLPASGEPILYRDWWVDERNRLKKVSLAELEGSTGNSYALEGGRLHMKLVVQGDRDYAVVDVCAAALCK